MDAQLTACAREEASAQPMDQILNGISALEDGVEGGSGGQTDAVIKALQPLKALIQSLKVGCGAHPLPVDRDEDMLEEEDEEVRSAKNALQMAVESAAKRRKAATPTMKHWRDCRTGAWVAVTDTGAAAPGNANLGPAPERSARLRGWRRHQVHR